MTLAKTLAISICALSAAGLMQPAAACSRSPVWRPPAFDEAFAKATTVLHVKVVEPKTAAPPTRHYDRINAEVVEVLKGSIEPSALPVGAAKDPSEPAISMSLLWTHLQMGAWDRDVIGSANAESPCDRSRVTPGNHYFLFFEADGPSVLHRFRTWSGPNDRPPAMPRD